jgi:hypothetical protein
MTTRPRCTASLPPQSSVDSLMRMLAIFFSTAICGIASAKCQSPSFQLSGTIKDWSGRVVPNAVIAASWVERGRAQGPVIARSDRNGHYFLKFTFNTYTRESWIRGDVCKGKLTDVAVSASASGLIADPVHIAVQGSAVTANLSLVAIATNGTAP